MPLAIFLKFYENLYYQMTQSTFHLDQTYLETD